tara:strand:- start:10 stop:261 length:252 start_codon:yes stop_codon:yes gene_type:complete
MVQEAEAGMVPDRLRRPCRLCMGEQAHYRMGEPEVDGMGILCVEFQCMGCMGMTQLDFGLAGQEEEIYIENTNVKRSNTKSFF